VLCLNSGLRSGAKELFDAAMPKAFNHYV
jgi:hypothetical protein